MPPRNKPNAKLFTLISVSVAVLVVLWFVLFGTLGAQSLEELQATVRELTARVGALQTQLRELTEGTSRDTAGVSAPTLTRNLTVGARGKDVRALQVFLNSDPRTRIAESGPGSPGNETDHFGVQTARAVARYQELNRDSILAPAGLARGSGFVGPVTRAHLQAVARDESAAATTEEGVASGVLGVFGQLTTTFQDSDELILSFPSQYAGPHGTVVRISGFGFTRRGNTVHLGDAVLEDVPSPGGTSISFDVPSTASLGKHELYVENEKGTSNKNLFFVVTDPSVPAPRINSSEPETGLYGEEVTIHGSGFTETGNDIYTSYGVISDVPSSDSTTLTFRVLPYPESPNLEIGKDLGQGIEWPVWFYIINDRGVTEGIGEFTLQI